MLRVTNKRNIYICKNKFLYITGTNNLTLEVYGVKHNLLLLDSTKYRDKMSNG